jgi:predicted nucleic acid-binding protein
MPFVLDSSVAIAWLMPDETHDAADAICGRLIADPAIVPEVWPLEIGNVLLFARRRGRLTPPQVKAAVRRLLALPIEIDTGTSEHALSETLELANAYDLTIYDAAYLELAIRRGLPLATLDQRLREASAAAAVTVLP